MILFTYQFTSFLIYKLLILSDSKLEIRITTRRKTPIDLHKVG